MAGTSKVSQGPSGVQKTKFKNSYPRQLQQILQSQHNLV